MKLSCKTFLLALLALTFTGCAAAKKSNTARTASEQLLLSNAIDRSLSNFAFQELDGRAVFVEEKYLDSVDKNYLVGSIRHRVLQSGGRLAASADSADVTLEIRSGGVGTDQKESFIGIPALGMPGLPIELPEVKLASRDSQRGTAKIGIVAYNPKTGEAWGGGGKSTAIANNDHWFVMGVGPFTSGAVKNEMDSAIGNDSVGNFASTNLVGGKRMKRVRGVSIVDRSIPAPTLGTSPDISVAELPAAPLVR